MDFETSDIAAPVTQPVQVTKLVSVTAKWNFAMKHKHRFPLSVYLMKYFRLNIV